MISGAQISQANEHAARRAAREDKQPFVYWTPEDITTEGIRRLPNIGDAGCDPAGWEELGSNTGDDEWDRGVLVNGGPDSDGPTVGTEYLCRLMQETVSRYQGTSLGFAIVSVAEWCVTVCAFKRVRATVHQHTFVTIDGFVCPECEDVVETVETWAGCDAGCQLATCILDPNNESEREDDCTTHDHEKHDHNICAHPFCEGEPEATRCRKCTGCGLVCERH